MPLHFNIAERYKNCTVVLPVDTVDCDLVYAVCYVFLVERPALAVRLDLSFRSVYFFIREYLPNC